MKAKLVKENIEFERGQEPSEAMDIGLNKYVIVYCGSTGEINDIRLMRGKDVNDIMLQLYNQDAEGINYELSEDPRGDVVAIAEFGGDFNNTSLKFHIFDKYNKFPKKL